MNRRALFGLVMGAVAARFAPKTAAATTLSQESLEANLAAWCEDMRRKRGSGFDPLTADGRWFLNVEIPDEEWWK